MYQELNIQFLLWCGILQMDFTHNLQGYFTGTGAIIWLPQCQRSIPEQYGWISQMNHWDFFIHNHCKTKHKNTICIFHGIYWDVLTNPAHLFLGRFPKYKEITRHRRKLLAEIALWNPHSRSYMLRLQVKEGIAKSNTSSATSVLVNSHWHNIVKLQKTYLKQKSLYTVDLCMMALQLCDPEIHMFVCFNLIIWEYFQ